MQKYTFNKRYELSNHTSISLSTGLGNVLAVISDRNLLVCDGDSFLYNIADVTNATDYSPFGAPLPGRVYNTPTNITSDTTAWIKGWEPSTVSTSYVGNRLKLDVSTLWAGIRRSIKTVPGHNYVFKTTVDLHTAGSVYIFARRMSPNNTSGNIKVIHTSVSGTYEVHFTALDTITYLHVEEGGSYTSGTVTFYLENTLVQDKQLGGKSYRFGFNGKERDNETYGTGNAYDFGARIYDARLGRWLSVDPLEYSYPYVSTYCFAMNKPIMFVDVDGRKILPTYTFLYSTYGNIYLNIMNNLSNMPVANIYLKKFIGPNSERDLLLSFSNLALTNDKSKSGPGIKAVSGEESSGRKSVTMFNSMGIFEPTSKIDLGDGTQAGKYISEFYMVTVVFHELIVHSSKLKGIGDRSFANNSKVMNDIKACILEYSKFKGDKLTGEEAAALAFIGAADANIDTKSAFFQANFKGKDLNYMKQVQDRVKYEKALMDITKGDREGYKAMGDMEYQESEEIKPE